MAPCLSLWRGIRELLLPTACAGCRRPLEPSELFCWRCLPAETPPDPGPPPAPLSGWAAGVAYTGGWETWIRRYKYPRPGLAGLDPAAEAVARDLIRRAGAQVPGPPPQRVVPVPLHPRRLRARGFSPAARLARELARNAGLPFAPRALERTRDTPSQTGLGATARRRNVAGAFRATGPSPARVWLVDDVATTGSTLAAAAQALRRAGAREVVGLCAAYRPSGPSEPLETAAPPRDPR